VMLARVGESPKRSSGLREANLPRHFENKKAVPEPQGVDRDQDREPPPETPSDELPDTDSDAGIK
jgi:hypothetical protein